MLYVLVSIIPQLWLRNSSEEGHLNDSAKFHFIISIENTINQQTTRGFEVTELNLPSWDYPGLSCTTQCSRSISTIFECGNNYKISWKELLGIQLVWRVQMKRATHRISHLHSHIGNLSEVLSLLSWSPRQRTLPKLLNSQSCTLWSCIILSMLNPRHLPFSVSMREAQTSNCTKGPWKLACLNLNPSILSKTAHRPYRRVPDHQFLYRFEKPRAT